MRSVPLLLLLLVLGSSAEAEAAFNCTSTATSTCQALVGYIPVNATTYGAISSLFQVTAFSSLLGFNNLPPSTARSLPVPAGSTVRVPFPCKCSSGTGISNRTPVYTVKSGDDLDAIARNTFVAFVTNQEIAAVNNIPNPNLILVGQKIWIPLPCSCDAVDGQDVVHYGHVVASGSSVEGIAEEFGTKEETLLRLNGMSDPKKLLAGQLLDVPLRACSSSISNTSVDHNLFVPNASYALTARSCVSCSCNSSSWQLDCRPTQGLNTSVCPPAKCGSLFIGDMTTDTGCEPTTCNYAGYTNTTGFNILTTKTTQNLCIPNTPNNNNGTSPTPQSGSYALRLGLHGSNWTELLLFFHMALLCFGFLWLGSN